MTQEEFDLRLEAKRAREAAIAAALTKALDEDIPGLLYEYTACKYLLEPEDFDTDDLLRLGEKSTAKLAGLKESGIEFREKSAGCTTASSGVIKKILLAMAVGKLLGIKLDPDAVAEAETLPQLAELVIKERKQKNVGY